MADIRIKFFHNYQRNDRVIYLFENFLKEHFVSSRWKNIVVCDNNQDINVCFNDYEDWMNPRNTVVIDIEPPYSIYYSNRNPDLLYKTDRNKDPLVWVIHLGLSYSTLNNIYGFSKTRNISSICSKLMCHKNQVERLDFITEYKNRFGLDVFGFYNNELPYDKKFLGMIDYKYHIQAENFIAPFHVSEKIMDAILSENLCFYYGAQNVSDIVDERSFIKIDISDYKESFRIINDSIRLNRYDDYKKSILDEKRRILNEVQLAPRLHKIINSL